MANVDEVKNFLPPKHGLLAAIKESALLLAGDVCFPKTTFKEVKVGDICYVVFTINKSSKVLTGATWAKLWE